MLTFLHVAKGNVGRTSYFSDTRIWRKDVYGYVVSFLTPGAVWNRRKIKPHDRGGRNVLIEAGVATTWQRPTRAPHSCFTATGWDRRNDSIVLYSKILLYVLTSILCALLHSTAQRLSQLKGQQNPNSELCFSIWFTCSPLSNLYNV